MSQATIAPIPPLLTGDELAGLLGLSRRQIDILSGRGDLPSPIRLGHRLRWRGQDVAEYLDRQPVVGRIG